MSCVWFKGRREGMCLVHGTIRDENEMGRLHFLCVWLRDKEYADLVARDENEMVDCIFYVFG